MYRTSIIAFFSAALALVLAGACIIESTAETAVLPSPQTHDLGQQLSSTIPADAPLDEPGKPPESARRAFNDFAWREFIALNWPADENARGKPDTTALFGGRAASVVWESWKSADELFPPNPESHPPTEWESYDAILGSDHLAPDGTLKLHQFPELPAKDAGRKRLLSHVTRLALTEEAGESVEHHLGPLIAQNGKYVRYEIRMNKDIYEYLRIMKYYIRTNLPNDLSRGPPQRARRVPLPCGSVIVKAAWMELTDKEDKKRFYHVKANLVDKKKDSPPVLRKATVGLVGLHIAHKTPTRPSWVWATFEHVDNTVPGPGSNTGRASFSRNDPATKNDLGFDCKPNAIPDGAPLPANPKPVDVLRITPIHPLTETVNIHYHKIEAIRHTVWNHYQLVAVQWMPAPDIANPGAMLPDPFPPTNVANTTLETYRQLESCLSCHNNSNDFQFVFFPTKLARP